MESLELDDRPVALIFRSPLFNASEGFVQSQAAALTRYQPVVLGLEDKGNAVPALQRRLILPRGGIERRRMALGDFSPRLAQLRALRPRLVHAHFGPDAVRALPLARALGVPLLTTFHGYDVQCRPATLLLSGRFSWMQYALAMRRLARQGTHFLAVSEALRLRAVARGFPEARLQTHHSGVDLDRFRPGPQGGRRERIVLHVGRLVEKKGTALLVRAFARVAATVPDARLVIVGDGPLKGGLQREVAALGLNDRVEFAGQMPREAVAELMQRAWLLAAPSITAANGDAEGLPTVIVEAMASALPVVASRHAGIPEAVVDGETGYLVPEGESEPLSEAMLRLLATREIQARLGEAARRAAESRFDARRQNARLEELYDRLSGG